MKTINSQTAIGLAETRMRTGETPGTELPQPAIFLDPPAESVPPLKLVGLYADLPLRALAMGVFRGIARNCEAVCKFQSEWWTFDNLTMPAERDLAARAVADAAMLWCAAHADQPLPEAVTAFVERWLARSPEGECALVALLNCPSGCVIEQSPSWTFLHRLARQARSEFFTRRFEQDGSRASETSLFAARSSVWLPPENDPVRGQIRWGINE